MSWTQTNSSWLNPRIRPRAQRRLRPKEKKEMSLSHSTVACGALPKTKLSTSEQAEAESGCIRNPRAVRRSGCTPAEPYPPNRKGTIHQDFRFRNSPVDKPHTRVSRFELQD